MPQSARMDVEIFNGRIRMAKKRPWWVGIMPRTLKEAIERQFRWQYQKMLPFVSAQTMQFANFYPHRPEDVSYILPAYPKTDPERSAMQPPAPPPALWMYYATSTG